MSARIVYFHGMPGGPGEWDHFASAALRQKAFVPDRNIPVEPEVLAVRIAAECGEGPLTLIGFSLGAPVALTLADLLGDQVEHIHLIAPAAPLELGEFLHTMAGAPLFAMAKARPGMFGHLTRLEGLVARFVPGFLLGQLMASAAGKDRNLRTEPAFRTAMARVLQTGLGRNWRGFEEEVVRYVAEWSALPARITAPVTIWQGDADNWTPPAMAEALAGTLGGKTELRRLPGCSHYSALRRALTEIQA